MSTFFVEFWGIKVNLKKQIKNGGEREIYDLASFPFSIPKCIHSCTYIFHVITSFTPAMIVESNISPGNHKYIYPICILPISGCQCHLLWRIQGDASVAAASRVSKKKEAINLNLSNETSPLDPGLN